MSDRDDDLRFDDDDPFGGDDDLFRGDDDPFREPFDELDDEADLEDFPFPDEDVPMDDFGDEPPEEGQRPNRAFIFVAAVLILLLCGVFAVVAFFLLRGQEDPAINATASAIVASNLTVESQLTETQLAITEIAAITQTAAAASPTPTVTPSPTVDVEATQTVEAEETQVALDLTLSAFDALTETVEANLALTQVAEEATRIAADLTLSVADLTATELAAIATQQAEDEPTAVPTVGVSLIQQTATALAELLGTPGAGTAIAQLPTATQEIIVGPGPGPGPGPDDQLPDTGLFDDLAAGGPGTFLLLAFGLLGVIVVTRRLRNGNRG